VKWLIYCPAITSDTLLYMITALESYSLRSYGGRLGVITKGMHAEGATTTSEFMAKYGPDKVCEMSHAELAVTKAEQWAKLIGPRWATYKAKNGIKG